MADHTNLTARAVGPSVEIVGVARDTYDALIDALITALPFLEDAKKSTDFKPGYVAGRITKVRAALASVGAL